MAKINDLEKMPYAELADMEVRIDKLRIKMRSEMQCARRFVGLANEPWPSRIAIQEPRECLDGARPILRRTVAATKGGKARKEDFLVWGP